MNVVSFGGGTNSTAMIIGMYLHKIPIDLILFADTGGEQPHTYEFIETFNGWLEKHGLPQITSVQYHDKDGNRLTLEQECINSGTLPSIAYGFKRCSLKHKIGTQEKFCNNYQPCGPAASASKNTSVTMPGRRGASNTPHPSTKRTKSTKNIIRSTNGAGRARSACV